MANCFLVGSRTPDYRTFARPFGFAMGSKTPDYPTFARPFGFWWLFGQLGFFSKSIEKSTSSNDAIGWSRSSQIGSQNDKKSMKIGSGDLPSSTFTLFSRTLILNDSTSILHCFSCRKAPGPTKNPIKMHPGPPMETCMEKSWSTGCFSSQKCAPRPSKWYSKSIKNTPWSSQDHPGGPKIAQKSSNLLQSISRTSKMIPKAMPWRTQHQERGRRQGAKPLRYIYI